MDHRDASALIGPAGRWLATLPLIVLILAESWIPTRMGIPPWPAFHLGLAAGLVIWGHWRVFAPIAVGLALGHGLAATL